MVDKDNTTIIGGGGDKDAHLPPGVAPRSAARSKAVPTSDYDKEKLRERLAKLSGGVDVIRVGAPSEIEMRNQKEAFDDAISATKAAVAEGIVPGGGLALLKAHTGGRERGRPPDILATFTPAVMILTKGSGSSRCARWRRTPLRIRVSSWTACARGPETSDSTPSSGEYRRPRCKPGIIDPTKVVRVALENAASVAGTLLLAEATMTEIEEPKAERQPPLEGL